MGVGYRAILRLADSQDAVDLAELQLHTWLEAKRRDHRSTLEIADWEGPGFHHLGDRIKLRVVHEDYESRHGRRRLYRLIESNRAGEFIVSIFAASTPRHSDYKQTLIIEVAKPGVDDESALNMIDVPRIASELLDAAEAHDGHTRLTGTPTLIRAGDTQQVIRAVTDPKRMASVVIAGSFASELDNDWAQAIASLTKQSVGNAATFVVCSDAMPELEAALGDAHRVGAGRIRTFLPKVDLSDPSDGFRHKWLGPATLERSMEGKKVALPLQRRHAEVARRRFLEAELPSDVRRTIGVLHRVELTAERDERIAERVQQEQARDAAAETAPVPVVGESSTAWLSRLGRTIKRWLNADEIDVEHVNALDEFIATKVAEAGDAAEQLDRATARQDELDEQIRALRRRVEDQELDLAQAEQDDVEYQRELTELRRRLAQTVNPDTYVDADDADWSAPDSVEELVSRITPGAGSHKALEYVLFAGDVEGAINIDQRYPSGLYATTMWQYVRVLHDYAAAKARGDFSGSVYMYLTDDRVPGTKCALARHAARESDTVLQNADWAAQRVFPVPTDVNESGTVLMDAHFKPPHRDTFAPRLYYYDDTSRSGKIYVGYIGRHLTNTRT